MSEYWFSLRLLTSSHSVTLPHVFFSHLKRKRKHWRVLESNFGFIIIYNLLYNGVLCEPTKNSYPFDFAQATYHINEKKTIQTFDKPPIKDAEPTKNILFFDCDWNCVDQFSRLEICFSRWISINGFVYSNL